MAPIQVCYLRGDTPPAAGADALDASTHNISLHPVDSRSALCEFLDSQPVDCLLTNWIDSMADRELLVEACQQHDMAVVWLTDEPTDLADSLASGRSEYISRNEAASAELLAHRIRAAVDAASTRQRVDREPVTEPTANSHPAANVATAEQAAGGQRAGDHPTADVDQTADIDQTADVDHPTVDVDQSPADHSTPASATEIVDRSQAGILVFDAEGLITRLNPAAEEVLGFPAAEAIGNNCEELDMRTPADTPLPQADRPVVRVLESGEPIEESVVSVPDDSGGRRYLSISASPLANGETVDGVVVTLEDISAAVELETTLETVLDRMTDGFVAFDTELRLTYFSKQAIDVDRYPGVEYLGSRLSDLGDHLTQYEADLREVLDTQEPKTVETYVPEPTGEWIRARLYPSETGVSVFFREVTAEKQRERELEQYKTIIESVKDGVCILNAEFEFVFVNEAFTELLGYSESELLGETAALVTDPEDMETAHDRRERLFAGDSKAAILAGEITAKSGERVPSETWMTPIELAGGETGTVGVVRDLSYRKRTEAMFTALYEAAHELLSARSNQEIAEIATEAATSVLDFENAIALQYDDETNVFEPLAYTPSAVEKLPELLPIAADATSVAGRAYFESELVSTEDLSELSDAYDPETPYRRAMFIPLSDHGVLFVGDTETGTTSDQTLTVAELLGATVDAAFDRLAADRQSQKHRQTLAEQTAELEALRHTTDLVDTLCEELFSAQSREAIETTVCSLLAEFDQYPFVWIGATESRTESVVVRAAAGDDGGYLDWLEGHIEHSADSVEEPTVRALASNEQVVVDRISQDWQTAPWRKEALSRGYQSVCSIPLTYNEISYGVLTVYGTAPGTFDEHTQTVLTTVGRSIAYVIASTETKQGLLADRRTELEVELTDSHDILHRLARRLGGPLSFEGSVPQGADESLLFFSVADLSTEAVEAAAAELCSIQGLRGVTEQNGRTLYEASVSGATLATTLVDCGAIPTAIETDGESQQATVTLPESSSVRTFMERLKAEYPSATVVSRQTRDGGPQTRETFQTQLLAALTDRQEETLRTAYFARYFDSPRGSTGTEVGAALGISQPTFNYHLRAALRTLLGLLFDQQPSTLDE